MLPGVVPSLPSIPSVNSLSSMASLSSLGSVSLGLAYAATTVAGSAISLPHDTVSAPNVQEFPNTDSVAAIIGAVPDGGAVIAATPDATTVLEATGGTGTVIAAVQDGDLAKGAKSTLVARGGDVITSCTVPGTAALTFDDGPHYYTEDVSRILRENDAVGTFFFNGNNYHCINDPDNVARIRAVYDDGHQVASHTWSHKDLATLSKYDALSEMSSVSQAIGRITGVVPAHMRPPYGSYNDVVLEAAAELGQDVILWDLDSGDSVGASAAESEIAYAAAVQDQQPILALNHETKETTVTEVLPAAIRTLKDAGYRLVSVAECTGTEPYLNVDASALPAADLDC